MTGYFLCFFSFLSFFFLSRFFSFITFFASFLSFALFFLSSFSILFFSFKLFTYVFWKLLLSFAISRLRFFAYSSRYLTMLLISYHSFSSPLDTCSPTRLVLSSIPFSLQTYSNFFLCFFVTSSIKLLSLRFF